MPNLKFFTTLNIFDRNLINPFPINSPFLFLVLTKHITFNLIGIFTSPTSLLKFNFTIFFRLCVLHTHRSVMVNINFSKYEIISGRSRSFNNKVLLCIFKSNMLIALRFDFQTLSPERCLHTSIHPKLI